MSSRQLRKLQKQRELELQQQGSDTPGQEEDESSEDEQPAPAAKPRVSVFAALGGEEDEDEDEQAQPTEGKDAEDDEGEDEIQQPAQSAKKSKKKKKKKAKAKAAAAAAEIAEDNEDEAGEDEIDKAIKELDISKQSNADADATDEAPSASTRRINTLLSINTYHLRAIHEMRNLFGRDVIESANAEEEQEANNRRRGRGGFQAQQQVDLETFLRGPPGAKKLPEVSLRRNVFIQGREHWPRQTAGGLTMKQIARNGDGSVEYAYVHDAQYDAVQAFFFSCVQIGDPMRIVYLLQQVPYHVSTLLQVSSVAKQDQNMALAAELCERALFTFGRVATSAFRQDLENGRARLDFRRPENRQLWLAGFHYLRSLVRKGTYRTALEWAKLLFAFDPQGDPYAMRHFIHFLAIRAHEARWLVEFMDELENMGDNRDTIYLRQSLVLAKLQINDKEGAKVELKNGMQRLPWLYCALHQELGLDAPPSIWGINADSDARSFWVKLYIYQTKDLWNNTAAISLLHQVAKGLDKVDVSLLPADDAPPDLGATRFVYLEGQTSILSVAPRALLDSQPNYEFDPLPPPEEENIFTGEGCRMPWKEQNQESRAMEHHIGAQLQNLMARQQARAQAQGGGGAGAGAGALFGGGDDDGNPELDAIDLDDPELRRDLEEAAQRANEPGIVQTLMRMLRGEPAPEAGDEVEEEWEQFEYEPSDDGPVPGAWPSEDHH